MKPAVLKSDKFKKARGGASRLLEIACTACGARICHYQKDGPGILKRMYVDRIMNATKPIGAKGLDCPECKVSLGVRMIYKKEDRPAYRLFVGAVAKKAIKSEVLLMVA
ncbi:MAG: hypothetical protein WCO25_02590 [Candidatus Uhrbacteria bacterium]